VTRDGLGSFRLGRSKPEDRRAEVLRRRLCVGQVEWIALQWFEAGRLAPASVRQQSARFQAVGVAPHGVVGDRLPKLDKLHPVLADQGPRCFGQPFRPAARVAGPAGPKAPTSDAARRSAVVLNAGHAHIFAGALAALEVSIPVTERERDARTEAGPRAKRGPGRQSPRPGIARWSRMWETGVRQRRAQVTDRPNVAAAICGFVRQRGPPAPTPSCTHLP
jgi:hypothetical protein